MLVTHFQGQTVPLVPLHQLLHGEGDEALPPASKADMTGPQQVLLVNYNNRRLGLLVDRFLRQQNIVIKPLSKPLDTIDLFGGVTLLGSGQVCCARRAGPYAALSDQTPLDFFSFTPSPRCCTSPYLRRYGFIDDRLRA
ncbi:MAG: chemotaxis protein CheW [Hymenobacter sp.]